jgi:benzylsuccinate CoA-transferase BbsF subunit
MSAPLQGMRVISFGTGAVIPEWGKALGEFGADVIKIESRENPDFVRTIGPDMNNIHGFNESNRSQRSFGVNLKTEKGKELVRELIRTADLVGENFRGGVMASLGFSYEDVRQIKPDIIYISSQGFGRGTPYSEYQAYGPMLAAASGVLSLWAHPDDPYPVGANVPLPDHMASKQAVFAVLVALDYRRRTGKGQFIDLCQVEVAASIIGEYYLDYSINHRVAKKVGNRDPYAAPCNAYRCKGQDQWCAITVFTNDEWQRFCTAIGNPDWTKDARFADTVSRLRNVDELDGLVEAWTSEHEAVDVMNTLQAAGVAAGMAQRAADTINDPHTKWTKALIELDHPVAGKRLYTNVPYKLSNTTLPPSRPAPLLGQHTEEICRELLRMPAEEIRRLTEEGVLDAPSP